MMDFGGLIALNIYVLSGQPGQMNRLELILPINLRNAQTEEIAIERMAPAIA